MALNDKYRELIHKLKSGEFETDSGCQHIELVQEITPSGDGCEDCLKKGDQWVHLRLCLICGKVGCCDNSKNRHASKHFRKSGHTMMLSFEPDEAWAWCYRDKALIWLD